MCPAEDDWRRCGQEEYLQGATLQRKRYREWSERWDHDHCEFCWTKFSNGEGSPEHLAYLASHPDVLTEGFAVQGRSPEGGTLDDYWWVCPECVADFGEELAWNVVDTTPVPYARTNKQRSSDNT